MRDILAQNYQLIMCSDIKGGISLRALDNLTFGHPNFDYDTSETNDLAEMVDQPFIKKSDFKLISDIEINNELPVYIIVSFDPMQYAMSGRISGITQSLIGASAMTARLVRSVEIEKTSVAVFRYEFSAEHSAGEAQFKCSTYVPADSDYELVPLWSSQSCGDLVLKLRTDSYASLKIHTERGMSRTVGEQVYRTRYGTVEDKEGVVLQISDKADYEYYGVVERLHQLEAEQAAIEFFAIGEIFKPAVSIFKPTLNRHATRVSDRIRRTPTWELLKDIKTMLNELKFVSSQTLTAYSVMSGFDKEKMMSAEDLYAKTSIGYGDW